ncbi:MAG: hypothetical protein H6Q38_1580 [Chloroflexi bacterium]|nr:hypothetical protein [Chloroflexota bacterium]
MWLSGLSIFFMRVVDVSLYTVRLMMVVRGRKALAWIFAFFQSFVFVSALRAVLADLNDWAKILGYSTGFATGILTGMWLEGRLAVGYTHLRVISPRRGAEMAENLRSAGYAVTEIPARGRDGAVNLLSCSVQRKHASQVEAIILQIDPEAFVTAEAVREVTGGFWKSRKDITTQP